MGEGSTDYDRVDGESTDNERTLVEELRRGVKSGWVQVRRG